MYLVELPAGGRTEIDVPVVAWVDDVAAEMGGIGAEIDPGRFVPLLAQVRPGGPADAAGLRNGDRVVAVDGAPVDALSPRGVWMLITNRAPGTRVDVTVSRGEQSLSAELVLEEYSY